MDHSFSTIRRASRSRARGVRAALAWIAWDTKTSWWERFLDSSTPHREVFTDLRHQIVSSHDLDQRAWRSQLASQAASTGVPRRSRSTAALAGTRPTSLFRKSADVLGFLRAEVVDAGYDLVLGSVCCVCRAPGRPLCRSCDRALPDRPRTVWPTPVPPGLVRPVAVGEYAGALRDLVLAHKEHGQLT